MPLGPKSYQAFSRNRTMVKQSQNWNNSRLQLYFAEGKCFLLFDIVTLYVVTSCEAFKAFLFVTLFSLLLRFEAAWPARLQTLLYLHCQFQRPWEWIYFQHIHCTCTYSYHICMLKFFHCFKFLLQYNVPEGKGVSYMGMLKINPP